MQQQSSSIDEVRQQYAEWTAMSVHLDTLIALHPGETFTFESKTYHGLWRTEDDESADRDTR